MQNSGKAQGLKDRSDTGIDTLFNARSVAVLGASADPGRLGNRPLQLLKQWGYDGEVYAVNPKYDEIDGVPCFGSILDIEDTPDAAYVVLPSGAVPGALEQCAEHGVGAAVVSTGGFSEVGAEGQALEERIRNVVRDSDMRLLGPNCEGLWNVHRSLPITFGSAAFRSDIRPGSLAIVSQSGSFGAGIAQGCLNREIGCGYLVTTGNEVDLTVSDMIDYFADRDDVTGIVGFVEGVHEPERFLEACEKARRSGKAIGFLRAGKTSASIAAMQSHTGRIVSSDSVYDALFRQAGVARIESMEGLRDFAESIVRFGTERPGSLGVVSLSGGACSVILDECGQRGIPMASFASETTAKLAERLPSYATITNPVDPAGVTLSDPQALIDSVRIVLDDPGTGAVLLQLANRGHRDAAEYGDEIAAAAAASGKPVILSFIDGLPPRELVSELRAAGIACFGDPAQAAGSLAGVLTEPATPESVTVAAESSDETENVASWAEAEKALAPAKVTFAKSVLASSAEELTQALETVGLPVVIKLDSDQSLHRSEIGGVRIGLKTVDEAIAAYRDFERSWGEGCSVLVQEMVNRPNVEALLSVRRLDDLGVVATVGTGGTEAELRNDVVTAVAPVSEEYLRELILETQLGELLKGYRESPAHDLASLAGAAHRLMDLMQSNPDMREIEINPLLVFEEGGGTCAVDIILR